MGNYVLAGYHGRRVPWRNTRGRRGELVGIELETENLDGYQATLRAIPDTKNAKLRPSTETDGSLETELAVEIVFPPIEAKKLTHSSSFFAKTLRALRSQPLVDGTHIGMHVNINTYGWAPNTIRRYVAAVHLVPREWLENLGGRELNRYCRQLYSYYPDWDQYVRLSRGSHGTAVSVRSDRLELRFPASSTDMMRIKNVLEFSSVLRQWAVSERSIDPTIRNPVSFTINRVLVERMREELLSFIATLPQTTALKRMKKVMLNGES